VPRARPFRGAEGAHLGAEAPIQVSMAPIRDPVGASTSSDENHYQTPERTTSEGINSCYQGPIAELQRELVSARQGLAVHLQFLCHCPRSAASRMHAKLIYPPDKQWFALFYKDWRLRRDPGNFHLRRSYSLRTKKPFIPQEPLYELPSFSIYGGLR
jgi:hypothetical protein